MPCQPVQLFQGKAETKRVKGVMLFAESEWYFCIVCVFQGSHPASLGERGITQTSISSVPAEQKSSFDTGQCSRTVCISSCLMKRWLPFHCLLAYHLFLYHLKGACIEHLHCFVLSG